jgi:Ala-tRNA(Pro) deacylase
MPCTAEQLFSFLDRLGIEHQTTEHPPIFTVEEGRNWRDKIPGTHCKSLFLKEEDGGLWLVMIPEDKRADLKGIAKHARAPRFSFAKLELMMEVLGITPGSVTPFALMNDREKRVKVVLDEDVLRCEKVSYHPLHNAA